jgi:pimeloyl-ACP methyl ester carboxylesterase
MMLPDDLFVPAGGLRLHALAWGDPAAPPVLLLHGSSGHAHLWDEAAAALADRYRVLALDLRGHGDSERPVPPAAGAHKGRPYRVADYAADVGAFAAALALPPVVLAGHSLGALVTMLVAGEGGLPLRGVALLDIEAGPPPYQAQHLNEAGSRPARRFTSLEEVIAFEARALPAVPRERLARIAAQGVRALPDGTLEHKADREALRRFEQVDYRPFLPGITCPALVVRGADSTVMRRAVAEQMAAALPRGRFVEIAAAGHQLVIEQPAAVAAALRAWLDEDVWCV